MTLFDSIVLYHMTLYHVTLHYYFILFSAAWGAAVSRRAGAGHEGQD